MWFIAELDLANPGKNPSQNELSGENPSKVSCGENPSHYFQACGENPSTL